MDRSGEDSVYRHAYISKRGMTDTREERRRLFGLLESPETQSQFWAQVADDVDWTVEGTHPLAGRYHTKKEFREATFGRLARVLAGGVKLEVQHLFVDGDTTVVELLSTSTTIEGAPFANTYCWVCEFEGDTIVRVRAYVDSAMVTYTILRNEHKQLGTP